MGSVHLSRFSTRCEVGRLPSKGEGMGREGETRDTMAGCKWRSAVRERNNIPYIIGCLRFAKTGTHLRRDFAIFGRKRWCDKEKEFSKVFPACGESPDRAIAMSPWMFSMGAGGLTPVGFTRRTRANGGRGVLRARGIRRAISGRSGGGVGRAALNGSAGTRTGRSGRCGPAEAVGAVPATAATPTPGPAGPGPGRSRPDDWTGRDGC